jgi:hypothetical protein
MAYSLHIPFSSRYLKIKSADKLRTEEKNGNIPMLRLGSICILWMPASKPKRSAAPKGTVWMDLDFASSPDRMKRDPERDLSVLQQALDSAQLQEDPEPKPQRRRRRRRAEDLD